MLVTSIRKWKNYEEYDLVNYLDSIFLRNIARAEMFSVSQNSFIAIDLDPWRSGGNLGREHIDVKIIFVTLNDFVFVEFNSQIERFFINMKSNLVFVVPSYEINLRRNSQRNNNSLKVGLNNLKIDENTWKNFAVGGNRLS